MSEEKSPPDSQSRTSFLHVPNPFVQKVREDFGPPSPVAVVRDDAQPAKGCFKKLRTERSWHKDLTVSGGPSSEDILKGKSLENEGLSPTLRREVELVMGKNRLLARRMRLTL